MPEGSPCAVKSANRTLDLFELLARAGQGLSHSEIAEALQIPKSSLTQILKNLVARGYVEQAPNGRVYRLGRALIALTQGAAQMRDVASVAEAFVAGITRQTRESSAFNQLRGDSAEVVAAALGPHRLVTHMKLGDRAPLYATSGGKAILAHSSKAFQDSYLARVAFEPFTPRTIRSVARLRRELKAIRETGLAYSHEEYTPGIVGIGVATLDDAGAPLGAFNVAIPASRFDAGLKRLAELSLRRAAEELRRHLFPHQRAAPA